MIALCVIKDHVISVGGRAESVLITKELLTSACAAHQRYENYLAQQRRQQVTARLSKKHKAAAEDLEQLKAKRTHTQASVDAMLKSADQFALDAEKMEQFTLIAKSNALRQAAKDKVAEVEALKQKVMDKEKELKELSA